MLGSVSLDASRWAPEPAGEATPIAHRGAHHRYDPTDVGRDDCTAVRLLPGQEDLTLFENTLDSIREAVRSGAAMVEVDVAHGYSADGGRTFPWRGEGVGLIPTVAEALAAGTVASSCSGRTPGVTPRAD